jgi:hypothetical protein
MAKQWRCRPSEYLGVTDPLAAFYFDRAIGIFGNRLEQELEKAEQSGKSKTQKSLRRTMILNKWLGPTTAKFAEPKLS